MESLEAQKDDAVAREDYLAAQKFKSEIDTLQSQAADLKSQVHKQVSTTNDTETMVSKIHRRVGKLVMNASNGLSNVKGAGHSHAAATKSENGTISVVSRKLNKDTHAVKSTSSQMLHPKAKPKE